MNTLCSVSGETRPAGTFGCRREVTPFRIHISRLLGEVLRLEKRFEAMLKLRADLVVGEGV